MNMKNQATINAVHEAINTSRNEQQKSVLLVEVARYACDTSVRLIEDCRQLLAYFVPPQQQSKRSGKRH